MDLPQRVERLSQLPAMETVWQYLDHMLEDILAEAVQIQQIPAPTFHELVRANHVLSRFGDLDLTDTGIDSAYNASGRLKGTDPDAPALAVCAHTDTVFTEGSDLASRQEEGRIYGPGLGDNSVGVAALIALADILRQFHVRPRTDIWFLANSREEGLGDLKGIQAFYEQHADRLGAAIVLEGLALGHIYHAGTAVRRLHIACQAEGGHSWQYFGQPNAIHSLLRLGAEIVDLTPPAKPKTTFNIGFIEGGHSVNSLATHAGFYLDMRSEDPAVLAEFEKQVTGIVERHRAEEHVRFTVDVVGDRPPGAIDRDHDLVRGAAAALQAVNLSPSYDSGSTDANLLLARGVPAVTIGITRGGNAHRPDEYIESGSLKAGMRQLLLLTLAVAEGEPVS